MNIFNRILGREFDEETCLGNPLDTLEAHERRMNYFAGMNGGRGFRTPKKGPKLSKGGKTRRERIREGVLQRRFITVRP